MNSNNEYHPFFQDNGTNENNDSLCLSGFSSILNDVFNNPEVEREYLGHKRYRASDEDLQEIHTCHLHIKANPRMEATSAPLINMNCEHGPVLKISANKSLMLAPAGKRMSNAPRDTWFLLPILKDYEVIDYPFFTRQIIDFFRTKAGKTQNYAIENIYWFKKVLIVSFWDRISYPMKFVNTEGVKFMRLNESDFFHIAFHDGDERFRGTEFNLKVKFIE